MKSEEINQKDKICVFDVCGTLYRENTTYAFIENYIESIPKTNFLIDLFKNKFIKRCNSVLFRLSGFDILRQVSTIILQNEDRESLIAHAVFLVENSLTPIEVTHQLLESFKKENYRIILMSASFDFIIEAIARTLNISEWYATRLCYHNHKVAGGIEFDAYGKKHKLIQFNDFQELIIVTDNLSDRDLVSLANKACIISRKKHLSFWKKLKNVEILEIL